MEESRKRVWDVRLGIITPVLTLITILIGVWQFNAGQRSATILEYDLLARQARNDFQHKVWERQLVTYAKVADLTGRIAAQSGVTEDFQSSVDSFKAMYWGAMVLVEDKKVESAMIAFRAELRALETGWSNQDRIKLRARRVAEACRESTDTTWRKIEAANLSERDISESIKL